MSERKRVLEASKQLATESELLVQCIDSQEFAEIVSRLRVVVASLENLGAEPEIVAG